MNNEHCPKCGSRHSAAIPVFNWDTLTIDSDRRCLACHCLWIPADERSTATVGVRRELTE